MIKVRPSNKLLRLADEVKRIESNIVVKVIDLESCLYKLRKDKKFDVEVSGIAGNSKCCKMYLWQRFDSLRLIHTIDKVPKEPEAIAMVINDLLVKADDICQQNVQ